MSIRLDDLSHRYQRLVALDRVSLHVREGDCYGFIGQNGAGKTTALRIALGLSRPASGSVTLAGRDALRDPRIRAGVGGLIEHPGFHENRSGPDNLWSLAALQGIPRRERAAEVERVLSLVGLADVAGKKVGRYSQGMRQRLGLAQALLGRPRYLVLDEPTNGLDPQGIQELRVLLAELARETGVTILLSSHLLTEVSDLCNRVGVLHRGRLLVESTTDELLRSHTDYRIQTDDDAGAEATLRSLGLPVEGTPGGLRVTLGETPPGDVVDALVAARHKVAVFAPIETTLEQIYLEYTRGERDGPPAAERPAPAPEPVRAAAPDQATPALRWPVAVGRIMAYEWRRLCRPAPLIALLVPALVGQLVVYRRHLGHLDDEAGVAGGSLQTATGVTAFDGLGRALVGGLPLLALIVAGLASQSIAGELRTHTLRNLLIRPFRRSEIAAGKIAVHLVLALAAYLLLAGSAAITAGVYFDYGALVELLPTKVRYEHVSAEAVRAELWPALFSPLVPLLAFTALGFLCGTLTRTAAGALAVTLGTVTALELGRTLARNLGLEGALPGPYLPSPLRRGSHLDGFVEFASGVSQPLPEFAFAAPSIWLVTCCGLAGMILARKYVP